MAFIRAEFQLTEPLCQCSNPDIVWLIETETRLYNLLIRCTMCNTQLRVPYEQFFACFRIRKTKSKGMPALSDIIASLCRILPGAKTKNKVEGTDVIAEIDENILM